MSTDTPNDGSEERIGEVTERGGDEGAVASAEEHAEDGGVESGAVEPRGGVSDGVRAEEGAAVSAVSAVSAEERADELDRFLTRCRDVSVASVPLYLALAAYAVGEDGWHAGYLVCAVLPLLAAYLGIRGSREKRVGTVFAGMVLGGTSLALVIGMAALGTA